MKYFSGFLFFLFLGSSAYTQFYEFGQDPGKLKWKQINTGHFRIIYPSDFSQNAVNMARLMENKFQENALQLKHKPSGIPLIIHNQSVYSNAFVTWAPKRMEFFTFPNPDQFPLDWLKELSLHETRHAIQIDKLNSGFTRLLSVIMGQQANGAVAAMMPLWFIEGDAVCAETSLSGSGRGRLPSFEMEIKAILLSEKKLYPLSKSYLGSYRDFVPDYYRIGYQMVSYARKSYGDDYWTYALDYVARKPFLVSPYFFYSRKVTGKGQTWLYKNTMDTLREHWSESFEKRNPPDEPILNIRKTQIYSGYSHPVVLADSNVIALKTGLDRIPRFVQINQEGDEKDIFIPGSMVSDRFSVYDKKIAWDEYVQDLRWRNRSYSVIREYDMETGKCRSITRESKYISPAWSPGGDSILVVNASTAYTFSLVILDASNGQILESIPSPDNVYLQYPEWIAGTTKIAVIATGEKGKMIFEYDIKAKTWTSILTSGFINMDHLKAAGDYLFFTAGFDGTDQVYSFSRHDKKIRKHTNSAFGAFHPFVSSGLEKLAWSDYTASGYNLVLKTFDPGKQEEFIMPDNITEQYFASVNQQSEPSMGLIPDTDTTFFEEKNYNKASHLFSFHSWAPFWFDYTDPNIDNPTVSTGITLLSQNHLSTAFTSLGYERANGYNYFHSRFTYKGFIPVIDLSTTYGGPSDVAIDTILPDLNTNLYSALTTYVPLSFYSGKFITGMQPSLEFTYKSTYYSHSPGDYISSGIVFFEPRLYLYSYLRTSQRDIQPRYGFTLDTRLTTTPFENDLYGSINSLRLNLYLPGILRNQGLKLGGEWQNQQVDSYYFMNHLSLPRGYMQRYFIKMNRFSADYAFPVVYPDLSLGALLYLKRIRANLFVDYMKGIEKYYWSGDVLTSTKPEYPLSQGLEVFADYHLFRFIVEFSSGARFTYFPHEKKYGFQMLFAVNLDKF